MLLQPITLLFSTGTLKPSVYTLKECIAALFLTLFYIMLIQQRDYFYASNNMICLHKVAR